MSDNMRDQAEALKVFAMAEELFKERKVDLAFEAYQDSAMLFRKLEMHQDAAVAFARAAVCEKARTGFEPLVKAALNVERAAEESAKAGQYADSRWHYREAGILYEREGDFEKYSQCFIHSQDTHLRHLWKIVASGIEQKRGKDRDVQVTFAERLGALSAWFFGLASRLLWGYGERPFRTILVGGLVIFCCAIVYDLSGLIVINGSTQDLEFMDALYFSGVTFSTLGYGDEVPIGWVRHLAVCEALFGMMLTPLFLIALTRRYLRVYQ